MCLCKCVSPPPFMYVYHQCVSVLSFVCPTPCYFPCVRIHPCNFTSRGFCSFGLSQPSTRVSIHHSLQAHPRASPRLTVPHITCRGSPLPPQAPYQARSQGRSVMGCSVGGNRPEETHTCSQAHTDRHTHITKKQGHTHPHTHKEQQGLSASSCSERGRRK